MSSASIEIHGNFGGHNLAITGVRPQGAQRDGIRGWIWLTACFSGSRYETYLFNIHARPSDSCWGDPGVICHAKGIQLMLHPGSGL